jgi:hypothetical protein
LLIVGSLAASGFHAGMYHLAYLYLHLSWAIVFLHHVSLRFRGLSLEDSLFHELEHLQTVDFLYLKPLGSRYVESLLKKVFKFHIPLQKELLMAKNENIKISFLGMKFESANPTITTIIILVIILIFFVALVVLLPKQLLNVLIQSLHTRLTFKF